jgi:predicted phage terminase large subunit-like protein
LQHFLLSNPARLILELDRLDCEESHLRFVKKFFPEKEGSPFLVGPHQAVIAETLDRVIGGEINRLIINVPPGYAKTIMAVIYFIARGIAINPRSRFIHASFNGTLALDNSSNVRALIRLSGYQGIWPLKVRDDTDAKGLWRTEDGGGLMAAAAGGPITGFRAGTMEPGFTGALIIDDPLKPDDADSELERGKINGRWHSTFKSRLAKESVPVIVIMQRLHIDDFSGFLLKGGSGEMWHHLMLPIVIENDKPYPSDYTHGIPIEHGLPDGPLWDEKHDLEQIETLKVNPFVFASQYMQQPVVSGGNLFKEDWFQAYRDLPQLDWRAIYGDTAQKTGERNDFSVFQCWGKGRDGRAYLIDQVRGKFEAPELTKVARAFWEKHKRVPWNTHGHLRSMKIEDKVSGTGLIQELRRHPNVIPVQAVQRDRDKVLRANDVLGHFATGSVCVPVNAYFYTDWRDEMLAFPNGQHDDQVDPTMDAVTDMLVRGHRSIADVL